nr:hypothetical protein DM860_006026 [Ipomoea batatas]
MGRFRKIEFRAIWREYNNVADKLATIGAFRVTNWRSYDVPPPGLAEALAEDTMGIPVPRRVISTATTEDADLVGVVSLCELGSTVTGGGGADDGSAGYGVGHLIDLAAMAPSRSVGDGGGPLSPVQRSTQAMMEETFDFRSSICSLPASLFLSLLADCVHLSFGC